MILPKIDNEGEMYFEYPENGSNIYDDGFRSVLLEDGWVRAYSPSNIKHSEWRTENGIELRPITDAKPMRLK